jgi:hypothetical protein
MCWLSYAARSVETLSRPSVESDRLGELGERRAGRLRCVRSARVKNRRAARGVSAGQQQHVDDLAVLVDRPLDGRSGRCRVSSAVTVYRCTQR